MLSGVYDNQMSASHTQISSLAQILSLLLKTQHNDQSKKQTSTSMYPMLHQSNKSAPLSCSVPFCLFSVFRLQYTTNLVKASFYSQRDPEDLITVALSLRVCVNAAAPPFHSPWFSGITSATCSDVKQKDLKHNGFSKKSPRNF